MIYDYVQTKPPMEEVIEHGWLKDQAAKFHKYLERHRNAAGKWVYTYYKKAKRAMSAKKDREARLNQARDSRNKTKATTVKAKQDANKKNRSLLSRTVKGLQASQYHENKRRKAYVDKKDAQKRKTNRANYEDQKQWREGLRDEARKKALNEADAKKRRKNVNNYNKRKKNSFWGW